MMLAYQVARIELPVGDVEESQIYLSRQVIEKSK